MISYQTDGVEMPVLKKRETTEWIKTVAATHGKRIGEIAYIFCSDEKIPEKRLQELFKFCLVPEIFIPPELASVTNVPAVGVNVAGTTNTCK